jgi:hypothetical protein
VRNFPEHLKSVQVDDAGKLLAEMAAASCACA